MTELEELLERKHVRKILQLINTTPFINSELADVLGIQRSNLNNLTSEMYNVGLLDKVVSRRRKGGIELLITSEGIKALKKNKSYE